MLNLTSTEQLNPPMKFKLFESSDFIGPLDSIQKAHNCTTSCPCKKPHVNNNVNEDDSNSSIVNTVEWLPPLLADDALAQAISEVQLPMDGWAPHGLFKLFVLLVKPPLHLNLDAIAGTDSYLTQLLVEMGNLIHNGICKIVCHCWCTLQSKHFTPNLLQL
jgi:hypothetical protein